MKSALRASAFLPGISNGTANYTRVFRDYIAFDGGVVSMPTGWAPCPVGPPTGHGALAAKTCVAVHADASTQPGFDDGGEYVPNKPSESLIKPADIVPGKFQKALPLGLNARDWNLMAVVQGTRAQMLAVVDYGVKDGLLWAKSAGLV